MNFSTSFSLLESSQVHFQLNISQQSLYKHIIDHLEIDITAQMKWQQDIHLLQFID